MKYLVALVLAGGAVFCITDLRVFIGVTLLITSYGFWMES